MFPPGPGTLRRSFVLALLCAASAVRAEAPASASASGALDEGDPRIEATLLFDVAEVKPGDTFRVGVRFKLDPGWHMYWKNPGDSGLSTDISWDAPGVELGPLQWPFPKTFRTADGFIVTYGYEDEALLFATAKAPADSKGPLTIAAAADLLVCEINCIPAELVVTRSLPVGAQTRPDPAARTVFDRFEAQVPRAPDESGYQAALKLDAPLRAGEPFSGRLTLTRTDGKSIPGGVDADFFVPERIDGIAQVALDEPSAPGVFPVRGQVGPRAPQGTPNLAGVVRLGTRSSGYEALALQVPMKGPAPGAAPSPGPAGERGTSGGARTAPGPTGAAPTPSLPLPLALVFAFFGGVILNLMPCVFPVLALKVYGFTRIVQEQGGRKGWHALAYALGILASMGVLAVAVIAVRAAGHGVGWGFQFQEPLFVAVICAVLVAFALNLFGVFDVAQPGTSLASKVDQAHGPWRSAGEGVLAVVLATPCSAPLLGSAVGFAIATGPLATVAVFLTIGLGLAAPFCLLVFVPGLARRLPKPGIWMERVKQVLGFALLCTAVWLVWVVGGLAGVDGMARLLAFLVAVGLAAWTFGIAQQKTGTGRWAGLVLSLVLLVVPAAAFLRFEPGAAPEAGHRSSLADAAPWDEHAVQAALADGRPVFIDFTADWCITCKFNERTVLTTDEVQRAFVEHQVAVFVADWTRRDERITAQLAAFGRAGVPMYLVISPHRPDAPEVLPEVITPRMVIDAIQRAATPLAGPT